MWISQIRKRKTPDSPALQGASPFFQFLLSRVNFSSAGQMQIILTFNDAGHFSGRFWGFKSQVTSGSTYHAEFRVKAHWTRKLGSLFVGKLEPNGRYREASTRKACSLSSNLVNTSRISDIRPDGDITLTKLHSILSTTEHSQISKGLPRT